MHVNHKKLRFLKIKKINKKAHRGGAGDGTAQEIYERTRHDTKHTIKNLVRAQFTYKTNKTLT